MKPIKPFLLLLAALALVLIFQNCSKVKYSFDSGLLAESMKFEDGQVFDGKIRILHHYVDNFTCNGNPVPESILIRTAELDWHLIQNFRGNCLSKDAIAVEGVSYDEAAKTAVYQNKLYVPPRPYFVDASADPNLSDVNLMDGVCANGNGQCSLQAAVQQSIPVSFTDAVIIHIPAGTFRLTKPLSLMGVMPESHAITIRGQDPVSSVLDGGGVSRHLDVRSTSMSPISVESLTFQNGFSGSPELGSSILFFLNPSIMAGYHSSGRYRAKALSQEISVHYPGYNEVTANPLKAQLNITNCVFKDNKNGNVVEARPLTGNLTIRSSIFAQNSFHGVFSNAANSLVIEDSTFTQQGSYGVAIDDNLSHASIKRSVFWENYKGVGFHNCRSCMIESIKSHDNRETGLEILATETDPLYDVTARDAKVYDNLVSSRGNQLEKSQYTVTGNLFLYFTSSANRMNFIDSNLSMSDPNLPNCASTTSFDRILMTNVIISDSSCRP